MTVVVKRTGTVPTTTFGGPDYWPQVSRTQVDPNQSSLNLAFEVELPPNTNTGIVTMYTVPVGFIFFVSSFIMNCNSSLIQRADSYTNNTLISVILYDMNKVLIDSTLGIIPRVAGDTIQAIIYNYDVFTRTFTGDIWGTLQRT